MVAKRNTTGCRISVPTTTWAYLLILVVVIVGSVMREINLLMILSGMMCAPLVINWQMARTTLRDLQVRRRLPRSAFAGHRFTVELLVANGRKRLDSWGLLLMDRVRGGQASDRADVREFHCLIPHVAAHREQVTCYEVQLPQRGRYRWGPLRLSTKAPLGLLQGSVWYRQTDEIVIFPQLGQLTARTRSLFETDRWGQRPNERRQGPMEGEFFGLRDWHAGDCRRWIHWRSSAKRQKLFVRQFEQQRGQDHVIWLDLGRSPATRSAASQLTTLDQERAIRFVATLLSDLCQRGTGQIGLIVAAKKSVAFQAPSSAAALDDFLEILADAQATELDPLPSVANDHLDRMKPHDMAMIVVAQPTQLDDLQRFPWLQTDAAGCIAWRRSALLDASSEDFDQIFVDPVESPENAPVGSETSASHARPQRTDGPHEPATTPATVRTTDAILGPASMKRSH